VKQVAIAGGRSHLQQMVDELRSQGDVFLVEDTLFGGGSAELEPLYAGGAIPTTYKSMYYELTVSVDDREWPSQQWVEDGETYYDLTKAPEDLPHLTVP